MGWGSEWKKPEPLAVGNEVTLTIPLNAWVTKSVKAIQVGDLAVVLFSENFDWLIIHVPTLTRFDNAIPDCIPPAEGWEEEQLVRWCWKVQQELYNDWQYLRTLNNSNYKGDYAAKEAIKTHCLSIGVE